jgi:thioredoxin reductase
VTYDRIFDVLVVGGGPAGLSAALMLGRSRRSVLVVDAGEPRNAPADGVHGLLGLEGTPPLEVLARGREEVRAYGVELLPGRAVEAGGSLDEGFAVTLEDGTTVRGRRLVVATGLVDELPDVPGVRERWGHEVLHCPYCHGWEVRDRCIGVLATGAHAAHQALLFRQLSGDVTVLQHTAPPPGEEQAEQLAARGIAVVEGEVVRLTLAGDGRVDGAELADGTVLPFDAVVVGPRMVARSAVLAGLGLQARPHPMGAAFGEEVEADATGATGVPGVWVAGNVAALHHTVVAAAAAGSWTGAQVNADLVQEEARAAVVAA